MYQAKKPITSSAELHTRLEVMHSSQVNKVIDHIDDHCRAWIERTTFITIASCDAQGNIDVSPKGDLASFVKVLDSKTLVIPDRIGNQRAVTFLNVLENSQLEMMIVVPRQKEVVRINGSAQVVLDDELLDRTTVNGHHPDMALLVRVQESFFHCGKSMIRSGMWQPEKWGSIDGLPTYSQALKDHGEMETPLDEIEARMTHNESDRLY